MVPQRAAADLAEPQAPGGRASRSTRCLAPRRRCAGKIVVARPLDALVLQIQGPGRLVLRGSGSGAARRWHEDGARPHLRAAQRLALQPVGRWLIEQGEPALSRPVAGDRSRAAQSRKRAERTAVSNPRYVFFREEPPSDLGARPRGPRALLTPWAL